MPLHCPFRRAAYGLSGVGSDAAVIGRAKEQGDNPAFSNKARHRRTLGHILRPNKSGSEPTNKENISFRKATTERDNMKLQSHQRLFLIPLFTAAFSLCGFSQTVPNPSFEMPGFPEANPFIILPSGSGFITGWTVGGAGLDYFKGPPAPSDGFYFVDLVRATTATPRCPTS